MFFNFILLTFLFFMLSNVSSKYYSRKKIFYFYKYITMALKNYKNLLYKLTLIIINVKFYM